MVARADDLRDRAADEAAEIEQRVAGAVGDGDASAIEAHPRIGACRRPVADGDEGASGVGAPSPADETDVDRRDVGR